MGSFEDDVNLCYRLLEEEILSYRTLNDALRRQSEALRTASVEPLMQVVRNVEEETERLHRLDVRMRDVLSELVPSGKEEPTLSRLMDGMSPDHRARMRSYKRTLSELQERMTKTNRRNQAYLREYLQVLGDLVSWILSPLAEPSGYSGQSRAVLPKGAPCSFQREV